MGTMTIEEARTLYQEAHRKAAVDDEMRHAWGLAAVAIEAERRGRAAALAEVTAWLRSDACGPYTGVGDVIADAIDAGETATTPEPAR